MGPSCSRNLTMRIFRYISWAVQFLSVRTRWMHWVHCVAMQPFQNWLIPSYLPSIMNFSLEMWRWIITFLESFVTTMLVMQQLGHPHHSRWANNLKYLKLLMCQKGINHLNNLKSLKGISSLNSVNSRKILLTREDLDVSKNGAESNNVADSEITYAVSN